jgi:hypothetical protein
MAKPNHTELAPHRVPVNPLSRPHWTRAYTDSSQYDAATLAGITSAIHALARVLANSEAFRDLHTHSESDTIEPGCAPLDAPTTAGLFAALYFLSEQAESLSEVLEPDPVDPLDVPY